MTLTGSIEERRIDGSYGEIWHEGKYQGDIASFTGRIAIERRQIQRAASMDVVFRRGVVTREGTLVINKVDSRFEAKFFSFLNKTVQQRRADRNSGVATWPDTDFIVVLDDPDSWGAEKLHVQGVKLWEIGLGFAPGDYTDRDLPITWQRENPLTYIPRPNNKQGATAHPGAVAAGNEGDPVW